MFLVLVPKKVNKAKIPFTFAVEVTDAEDSIRILLFAASEGQADTKISF
jgi:hypothetical protein